MSGPALAVGTPQYGSVKLEWNVATAMTAVIHSSYTTAFAYAAPTLSDYLSNPTGTCDATLPSNNVDLTLDYGILTPSLSASVGCTYLNAVGASVQDNDAAGVKVYEALDAALPTGTSLCAYPNQGASFPESLGATITASTRTGTGPAPSATCATSPGAQVPVASGGAVTGTAGTSSTVGGTGETYQNSTAPYSIGGLNWISTTSANSTVGYAGEDLQLVLANTVSSTTSTQNAIMTIQFIPN